MKIGAEHLKGTGVAVVTPFNENKEIDFQALKNIVNFLIDEGVDYLVALGTTAETVTLTLQEQENVANCIYEETDSRVPLVIGASGNNTSAVVESIQNHEWVKKFDALLIATPYYNKPNQVGLYEHYKTIAKSTSLPIILYNVPGRTGVNMLSTTTLKLANEFKCIIAIKEASGDLMQINQIINNKPTHFEVISGDDGLTLPMISIGAQGVISVLANALPNEICTLVNAALENNYDKARLYHKKLFNLSQEIFLEGNPTGIKTLMHEKGLLNNELRLPLVPSSYNLTNLLIKSLASL